MALLQVLRPALPILIGAALACTATAIALSVAANVVSETVRSTVLGIVSAAGSLGALLSAPIGQLLNAHAGWRVGLLGFALLALLMIPAAWYAGRIDRRRLPRTAASEGVDDATAATAATAAMAAKAAFGNASFVVMSCAFMVCGMQLVFLTTHLPSYLAICGLDPMLSAQALGMIYLLRSLALAWYFMLPATPESSLLFGAIMGFLWLGVSPLAAGAIAEMFGLRWQAMIQGLAFMIHQLGSFLGAYGGGLLYDALGSYTMAWRLAVALGLAGGTVQLAFALIRPSKPPVLSAAQG